MSQAISLHAFPHHPVDAFRSDLMVDNLDQASRADAKPFPLIMAGDGERVRIRTLQGGKGLVMRLTELGLNQGTEVRVVQRQGGGLVVARGETRIALGGGMASKILVEAIAP